MKESRRKAKKRLFVLSVGYWFGAHSLGLWLHPYQSMRRIVREGVFVPLTLLPSVCLGVWWVVGWLVSRVPVLARLGFSGLARGLEAFEPTKIVLSLGFLWAVVVLWLWQGLLFYLYWRFRSVKGV